MKTIKTTTSLYRYKTVDNNIIICDDKNIKLVSSQIIINGSNNIIFFGKSIVLENSIIKIDGNNNIIYLSENSKEYFLNISIYNNSVFYSGKNNYFNGVLNIIISEGTSVIIGDGCLFSFGSWLRTADPHLIYDGNTGRRLNMSKNIYIGDHVWVGQYVFLGKGTMIGSGSILGANSVKSGKVYSNTICAGNPAKELKRNIFWIDKCVHRWNKKTTLNYMNHKKQYIYTDKKRKNMYKMLDKILKTKDVNDKYVLIINKIVKNNDEYRFSLNRDTFKTKLKNKIKRVLDLFDD